MEGGIKKTIILTINGDLHSELKIIANSEEKSIEELLQDWVRNLVKSRGTTQYIDTNELERAKRELTGGAPKGSAGVGSGVGMGGGQPSNLNLGSKPSTVGMGDASEGPRTQTRMIRSSNEEISVGDSSADTVVFFCHFCFQKCRVPKKHIGQKVECPRCRNPLTVPRRSS